MFDFNGFSVAKKLTLGFALVLFMTIGMGIFAIDRIAMVNQTATDMEQNWLPSVAYLSAINNEMAVYRRNELQHILSNTEADLKEYEKKLEDSVAAISDSEKKYEPLVSSPEERRAFDKLKTLWPQYLEQSRQVVTLSRQGKDAEARDLSRATAKKIFDEANETAHQLMELNRQGAAEASNKGDTLYEHSRNLIIGTLIGATLFAALIAFWIARSITKPLSSVAEDLSVGSREVGSASMQLSSAAQNLSAASTESASSLEETVSALEELSSMINRNADNCNQADRLAQAALGSSQSGAARIKEMIVSVEDIAVSSRKITEIISVIDDISFQTNLLALNAAVEAARAGEQGRGFAVVAEAVRNLAQRSASSAKEISLMIKESSEKAETGLGQASTSAKALDEIMEQIAKLSSIVSEINSGSTEQAKGITEISGAMNQLDQATQKNAATAEESAAASEELSAQATALTGAVQKLMAVTYGSNGSHKHDVSGGTPTTQVNSTPTAKNVVAFAHKPSRKAAELIPLDDSESHSSIKSNGTDGF
jgi:methyl-accepting chemotaxis protein